MSVKAMAWAWEQEVPSTAKFVLLALADHADHEGVCWPGQKGLADKTGLTRRSINTHVGTLAELKLIEVKHRYDTEGRPQSNYYRLCINRGGNENDVPRDSELKRQGIVKDVPTEPSVRTDQRTEDTSEPPPDLVSPTELMEGWNDTCGPLGLPTVRELSADRLAKVRARLREHPKVFFWNDVFAAIEKSPFLRGLSGRNGDHKGWKASFDWLIENPTNSLKIAEGQYNA